MCGRFALALQADQVEQLDGYPALHVDQWVHRDRHVPRYNVAPRTHAPVIRRARPEQPALVMHSMRWGLVPHWNKAEPPTLNTINARAENLEEGGGMWGTVKGRKRCVVVVQGYYEWLKKGTQRTPHFTRHSDGRLMLFAGLYDCVTFDGQSEPLWTFTIVTTAASSSFAWLHDRQPVILTSQHDLDHWLDTSTQTWDPKLNRLFAPYSDSDAPLECYAVPTEVGKVGTESPTFIEPVQKRKDGIEAMFMRQAKTAQKSAARDALPAVAAGSGKRKREPSPMEGDKAIPMEAVLSPFPSPTKHIKVERDPNIKLEPPVDVDTGDSEANSDVEILSADPLHSNASRQSDLPKAVKPKPRKKEQDDVTFPSSSQRQQQQQPSSQSASKKKINQPVTSPRKKKQEKSELSSDSTPKITSFFAKAVG